MINIANVIAFCQKMPKVRDMDTISAFFMYFEHPLLAEFLLLYENAEVSLSEKSKQAKQNLPLIPYPRTIYYMIDVT